MTGSINLSDSGKKAAKFTGAIEGLLQEGLTVRFSALGNSMHPTIRQFDTLIIEPCDPATLSVDDIALFKHNERLLAHRIVRIELNADQVSRTCPAENGFAPGAASPPLKSRRRQDAPEAKRSSSLAEPEALVFILRGDFRQTPDLPVCGNQILGKVTGIISNGRHVNPYRWRTRWVARVYRLASQFKSHLPI